jgi:hypothetical protein
LLPDNLLCRWRSLDDASLDLDNEDEDKDEDEDGNGNNVNEDDAEEGSDRAYNDATRSRGWVERECSGSRRNEGGRTTTTTKTTRSTKTREEGGEEGQRDGDVVVLSTIMGRDDNDDDSYEVDRREDAPSLTALACPRHCPSHPPGCITELIVVFLRSARIVALNCTRYSFPRTSPPSPPLPCRPRSPYCRPLCVLPGRHH